MSVRKIAREEFLDGARQAVVEAIDAYVQAQMADHRVHGYEDADLPKLFKAIDAHMEVIIARINAPDSTVPNSAFVQISA